MSVDRQPSILDVRPVALRGSAKNPDEALA
jgi:hypothetical protein